MAKNNIIFEKSSPGRWGVSLPASDVPEKLLSDTISPDLLREKPAK